MRNMADNDLLDGADEELGGGVPQERDWRGIGTALLVIFLICSLIGLAVLLFTPLSANRDFDLTLPAMNDLPLMIPPLDFYRWKDDNTLVFKIKTRSNSPLCCFEDKALNHIFQLDLQKNETISYFNPDMMRSQFGNPNRFELSSDTQYMCRRIPVDPLANPALLAYHFEIVHRTNMQVIRVGVSKETSEAQQMFYWGPSGNEYVFVQNGSIYYVDKPESTETLRVSDGAPEKINGVFDWIYTEEIFETKRAMWWSNAGRQLAFVSQNPSNAQTIKMTAYRKGESYPSYSEMPYPKANARRLPVVALSIWDKHQKTLREMDVQHRDSTAQFYLFSVQWVQLHGKERILAVWANRYQNQITVTLCDFDSSRCQMVYEYSYHEKQWALPSDFSSIMYTDDAIFLILPRSKADGNIYNHIVKLTVPADLHGVRETTLSIGLFDVEQIVRLDKEKKLIYFMAKAPSPSNQHMYVTSTEPATNANVDACRCVTCFDEKCTFQSSIQFSPDGKKLVILCRGPGIPTNYVVDLNETSASVKISTPAMNSAEYLNKTSNLLKPVVVEEDLILDNGYVARTKLLLPTDQTKGGRGYPVLIYVYGGPHTQSVTDEWKFGIENWLCLNRSMAILYIDGRGSGGRGWKYRSPLYGALGTVEIQDQVAALQKILDRHSYLDKHRVSVFGWSYGGFAAANMVEIAPLHTFKCAISVAPVTNFLYYDTTYTERYMGNAERLAYDRHDLTRDVEKFRSTKLLLMHGLYDDNVHFQNSAIFIEELQKHVIDFDLMVYPNQAHSITYSRSHLYQKFYNFLDNCVH